MASAFISDDLAGLILTLASSFACILGSLVICTDAVWRAIFPTSTFDLNNNQAFLVCSLALSSGVLIYTSMYKLLPEAMEFYRLTDLVGKSPARSQALLVVTYLLGVAICAAINRVVHIFTEKSVVQCAHDGHSRQPERHTRNHDHSEETQLIGPVSPISMPADSQAPDIDNEDDMVEINKPTENSVFWAFLGNRTNKALDVENGFATQPHSRPKSGGSTFESIEERRLLTATSDESTNYSSLDSVDGTKPYLDHLPDSSRQSYLFSIGLQTAIAISVHKVPEGFLTFATSHADRSLGVSVFIALAIHNISEGFTIAFPLFLALGSRTIAIAAAFVLGGLSQPFGAFLAWALFKSGIVPVGNGSNGTLDPKAQLVFGIIVSITAGFLSIIGFQMYGTAISLGGKQHVTLAWVFIGIAIVGLGSSLT